MIQNEYGYELDRNGYAPSILNRNAEYACEICLHTGAVQRHEVFHGPYRATSKAFGLWLNVCPHCHYLIHNGDGKLDKFLKENAQKKAMERYRWTEDDFRQRFGKSYV